MRPRPWTTHASARGATSSCAPPPPPPPNNFWHMRVALRGRPDGAAHTDRLRSSSSLPAAPACWTTRATSCAAKLDTWMSWRTGGRLGGRHSTHLGPCPLLLHAPFVQRLCPSRHLPRLPLPPPAIPALACWRRIPRRCWPASTRWTARCREQPGPPLSPCMRCPLVHVAHIHLPAQPCRQDQMRGSPPRCAGAASTT